MLTKAQKITIEGKSVINGVNVAGFVASIDSTDPSQMTLSSFQINKQMYKDNRTAVRADEAEFEDYAYSIQDTLLAEKAVETETETGIE